MTSKRILLALPLIGLALPALAESGDPRGFYIGLGGGINYVEPSDVQGRVGPAFFRTDNVKTKLGWAADGYIGYQFGNAKFEFEGVYRDNKIKDVVVAGSHLNRVHSAAVMANLIWEFFARSTVTPYIGAGAGVARVWVHGDKDYEFAFQGIAGVNVKLSDNVILGLDYRYFRTVDPHLKYALGSYTFDYVNHSAMVTLTYRFSSPRAAPVAAVAPAPAPPPAVSRNYMVFFDFDRSEITAQADGVIKQAAAAAKQGNIQRLNVTGHTDRAGTEQYNMALSLRRANAVKNALVREGIAPDQIAVVGRGESENLVPTADGVREAQNRRVEIVLQ